MIKFQLKHSFNKKKIDYKELVDTPLETFLIMNFSLNADVGNIQDAHSLNL